MSTEQKTPIMGWSDAREQIRSLEAALETRSVIARAQGILMERYTMDADGAIALLKRTSSELNIKVLHIAEMLIETRQLPRSTAPMPPQAPRPRRSAPNCSTPSSGE